MRVVYNWLKEYIDVPYNPEQLDHVLTMAGLEVDEVEYLGEGLEKIVIGEIKKIIDHPDADKLVICEVDIGDKLLKIITGAPNVKEGAKVPVATVGTVLPNGMEIKKAKLRGEPSYGMICSTDELGLSKERASGIMILDEQAEVGSKLIDYLGLNEYVLNLDLTPNYARCLGMLGIARELAALQDEAELISPEFQFKESDTGDINDYVSVEIEDRDLCPRYTGRIIKNIEVGPSPLWMQRRLTAAGIRPINNVVDITNYVLLEYNQPLHAFDFDKINGNKVIVRRAKKDEKITTLDDQERELDEDVLVIADSKKAIGLAGVMGGANSEVTANTTTVFLESAYFNPVNIRKTAKKLGLPSEASHRFERGIDIEGVLEASNRAAYLLQEYAGGSIKKGIIDEYPIKYDPIKINLEVDMVNKILGLSLSTNQIKNMLERLDFDVQIKEKILEVTVPSFRNDVEREADLIEEVARVYGYNKIPVTKSESKQKGGQTYQQKLEDISKELMLSAGLDEVINLSLTGEKQYDTLNLSEDSLLKKWVRLKNPLNESYAIMRTSLIPGMLEVLSNNAKRQVDEMAIFELGNIYFKQEGEKPFVQLSSLGGASMGHKKDSWDSSAPDFFYLKGVLELYFKRIGIDKVEFEVASVPYLHPGRSAMIVNGGKKLGIIGEVLPDIIQKLDLKERTAVFQLDFEKIVDQVDLVKKYEELPKFPAVERDLAILVKREVKSSDLLKIIKDKGEKLLKDVEIFDLYQGDQIPPDQKSIAFKLNFQASDRTLRDNEVNKLFNNIIKELENQFSAKIRGN